VVKKRIGAFLPGFDLSPSAGFIPAMPRKFSEILEEARALPYGERAELIEQLIADAAKDPDPEIEKAWGDEAMRRIKEIEEGKVQGIPVEQAMAEIRKIVGLK
jgi:putative addiction module component (TIGR02574 family)